MSNTAVYGRPAGQSRFRKWKRWVPLYLMMLPGLLYLFINNYIPMAGLVAAFKNVNFADGIWHSDWADPLLKNFEYLFVTKDAWVITRNTILYNLAFIIINTAAGILIAILICDIASRRLNRLYQSSILLPFLMSYVIVSYIVFAILSNENGLLNKSLLPALGMEPVQWYASAKYWPFILVLVNFWKGMGYNCLIYIASINGIDPSLYEAAKLDGAGRWQQIRNVTLPGIKSSVITLTMLNIGRIFYSDFSLFYQVPQNSGLIYSTTNTLDTYVYRALLNSGNIPMAAAAGFYQSLIGFVVVLAANLFVRKISKEDALF